MAEGATPLQRGNALLSEGDHAGAIEAFKEVGSPRRAVVAGSDASGPPLRRSFRAASSRRRLSRAPAGVDRPLLGPAADPLPCALPLRAPAARAAPRCRPSPSRSVGPAGLRGATDPEARASPPPTPQALQAAPSADAHEALARAYIKGEAYLDAAEAALKAVTLDPQQAKAYLRRGCAGGAGRGGAAAARLRAAPRAVWPLCQQVGA
jgi:tetratricopeptide (TPR) repeat protein